MIKLETLRHQRDIAGKMLDEGHVNLSINIIFSALKMDADTHLPANAVIALLNNPMDTAKDTVSPIIREWLEKLDLREYAEDINTADVDIYAYIDALGLSTHSYDCFWRAGIETVESIISLSADGFKHIRNFGRKSQYEVLCRMYAVGYTEWVKRIANTLKFIIERGMEESYDENRQNN